LFDARQSNMQDVTTLPRRCGIALLGIVAGNLGLLVAVMGVVAVWGYGLR